MCAVILIYRHKLSRSLQSPLYTFNITDNIMILTRYIDRVDVDVQWIENNVQYPCVC